MSMDTSGLMFPKTGRLRERVDTTRDEKKQAAAFRAAVWRRDEGRCVYCSVLCKRTLALESTRGEVHHLRGRRVAPADVFNVKKAVLLCKTCHQLATEHRITVKAPR